MSYDAAIHHRRSVRLRGYDYSANGAYFVTICVHQKRQVFGRIENGVMRLNQYGAIAHEEWQQTGVVRPAVVVDEFVIMPNHVHGILIFTGDQTRRGAQLCASTNASNAAVHLSPMVRAPRSLGSLVAMYKATVTRRLNQWRAEQGLPVPIEVWQRSFYERIIRDENELNATRRYIIENPSHWATDEHHL